jgi:predicted transglutaminase-like cysteine proteinase
MAELVSFRFLGDKNKGKNFVGAAKQGIEVLKNLMQLGGLNSYSLSKTFDTGETIFLKSNFGITTAYIYCPAAAGGLSAKERRTRDIEVWTTYKIGEQHNYFIFHKKDAKFTVANCKYEEDVLTKLSELNYLELLTSNSDYPVTFHCKRFSHNVPSTDLDGVVTTTTRDLYFIATSLYIPQDLYLGWKNFAVANPTFPLVTNNSTNNIVLTTSRYETLEYVNRTVNSAHEYSNDSGGENWKILANGETGDCEDFALTKAKMLLDLGYPASALHIECAMYKDAPVPNVGHAWLVVQTDQGDYALDNLHNEVQANINMKSIIGTDYIMRRRQIGMNWAFISPFGWMISSINDANYTYHYILDPLLNIFHLMSSSAYPLFGGEEVPQVGSPGQISVNFSVDNKFIYYSDYSQGKIWTYQLQENNLKEISSVTNTNIGCVNRDGTVPVPDIYDIGTHVPAYYDVGHGTHTGTFETKSLESIDVSSPDGYYDYSYIYRIYHNDWQYDSGIHDYPPFVGVDIIWSTITETLTTATPEIFNSAYYSVSLAGYPMYSEITGVSGSINYFPFIVHSKEFNQTLYWRHDITYVGNTSNSSESTDTFGWKDSDEIFTDVERTAEWSYGDPWNVMEVGISFLQGFRINTIVDSVAGVKKYLYKDKISILATVTAAVGTTEANLLGFVYLPFTNRLRGAKTLKTITIEE